MCDLFGAISLHFICVEWSQVVRTCNKPIILKAYVKKGKHVRQLQYLNQDYFVRNKSTLVTVFLSTESLERPNVFAFFDK